jgi:multidrug efflux system membrane fusion protein
MKRLAMLAVFCAIGAAAYGGWWWWEKARATVAESGKGAGPEKSGKGAGARGGRAPELVVRAAVARTKPMPVLIEEVGTVEPEHSVQVRAQVSGVLQSVLFKEGDKVRAGQLLFQLDPRTYEAAYRQAQAQLARDLAQLENARVQRDRLEPLLQREFITRQEFDVAVTSTRSLEATVAADRALVEQAKIQLDFTRIHAPISGRTGALSVKPGNLVVAGAGGPPLVTINSTDPVLVSFSVPERRFDEIRRHRDEKEMRIEILSDRDSQPVALGKLDFIDNTVTPQTGTVLLKTRVPNGEERLWPGQFVNVRIVLKVEPEALVVPEAAVQPGQDGPFVYLVDGESRVRVQPIRVARQIGGEVVVASGLRPGDRVITEIPQALQPGAVVRVAGAEEEARPGRAEKKTKGGKKGERKAGEKAEG